MEEDYNMHLPWYRDTDPANMVIGSAIDTVINGFEGFIIGIALACGVQCATHSGAGTPRYEEIKQVLEGITAVSALLGAGYGLLKRPVYFGAKAIAEKIRGRKAKKGLADRTVMSINHKRR